MRKFLDVLNKIELFKIIFHLAWGAFVVCPSILVGIEYLPHDISLPDWSYIVIMAIFGLWGVIVQKLCLPKEPTRKGILFYNLYNYIAPFFFSVFNLLFMDTIFELSDWDGLGIFFIAILDLIAVSIGAAGFWLYRAVKYKVEKRGKKINLRPASDVLNFAVVIAASIAIVCLGFTAVDEAVSYFDMKRQREEIMVNKDYLGSRLSVLENDHILHDESYILAVVLTDQSIRKDLTFEDVRDSLKTISLSPEMYESGIEKGKAVKVNTDPERKISYDQYQVLGSKKDKLVKVGFPVDRDDTGGKGSIVISLNEDWVVTDIDYIDGYLVKYTQW